MKILVSNDDGIYAKSMWILAKELSRIAEVSVVAPDREQSAVGTAVTLRKPLRVQKIAPLVPGIEAHLVEGTPGDSVILALGKIVKDKIDLVISGINQGSNLGEDVLISGTVGAALAGYLRGYPAISVSCGKWDETNLKDISRFMVVLVQRLQAQILPADLFLNVNFPDIPLSEIKDVRVTRIASKSHINTVEEGHDGKKEYYWLMRQSINREVDKRSDVWAVSQGNISITPLHILLANRFSTSRLEEVCSGILGELKG